MYIGALEVAQLSSNSHESNANVMLIEPEKLQLEWFDNALKVSWEFIVKVVNAIIAWLMRIASSLSWFSTVFSTAYDFLKTHPHPIHIICWSLFFGPIIILMPCLLVLEVIIFVFFNLNFITHGVHPGSPEDKFESLHEYFMESRESLFASVESATAKFNKWTVESPPLLVARLIAGIAGFLLLIGIWSGW